jgi:uracil phosphoribosyltransferase
LQLVDLHAKAIDILKEHGATDISYVGLVGCPEGMRRLTKRTS